MPARHRNESLENEPAAIASLLAGQLVDFQLPDIVQLVSLGKKTGELRLRYAAGQKSGSLYFELGMLVHATCGEESGEAALREIAGWHSASFSFLSNQGPIDRTIDKPAVQALLEAFSFHDELELIRQRTPADGTRFFISPDVDAVPAITPGQWKLLSLVNGRRTISAICQAYGNELEARKAVARLIDLKLVTDRPHNTDWYRLVPKPRPSGDIQGSRSFPTRLLTNLLLKAIDGRKNVLEIRLELDLDEKALWNELKYLVDEQWIHFDPTEAKRFYSMEQEF